MIMQYGRVGHNGSLKTLTAPHIFAQSRNVNYIYSRCAHMQQQHKSYAAEAGRIFVSERENNQK